MHCSYSRGKRLNFAEPANCLQGAVSSYDALTGSKHPDVLKIRLNTIPGCNFLEY